MKELDSDAVDPDYASRLLVAQMKKTDREKDWPFVFLARPAGDGDGRCGGGVLHGQEADWLIDACRPGSRNYLLCRTNSPATVARSD